MDPYMVPQMNPRVNANRAYPMNPKPKPRLSDTSRPKEVKRKQSLSSTFPFNQCTDLNLRETKKSLEQGLRMAVHHYSSHQFQMFHINYNAVFRNDEASPAAQDVFEWDFEPHALVDSKFRQSLALPPILVRNSEPDRDRVITLLNSALHACLQRKLRLSEVHMVDPMVQLSLHYATNLFLQGFKSPSTKILCDDIIRDNHSGELDDALSDLVSDFLDKYEEMALDSYEDVVMESVTKAQTVPTIGTVDNPNFVAEFRNIWKLDKPNFLEFNVRVFIEEFVSGQTHQYSYNSYRESYLVKLGEVGLTMNILRASLNYRDELLQSQPRELTDQNIVDMPEFAQLQQSLLDILETAPESVPAKSKAKSLRFADA